ncbi:MAG: hypothetical protein HQL37_01830 [Alphaproteobacteria bacterium]|nr:hypothetical protein [Alphaproteobacteria bacterium]
MKAVAVMTLGLVAGCSSPAIEPAPVCNMEAMAKQRQLVAVPPNQSGEVSPLHESPLNAVNITDFAVTDKVYVRAVSAKRTPTGTVEVNSQIINCTDYPLHVEARTHFFDAKQAPSEPVSAWQRVYLDPRTTNAYHEQSTGTDSTQFYLVEVREGR